MDSSQINNWYTGELVAVNDMKPVNSLILLTLFATSAPGKVIGIVPTLDTGLMTFATTDGFAFFGITADPDYITDTGCTTLGCVVEAQGAIPLVDLDCYIYIMPDITTIVSNRYTVVTGIIYSSTNAADVGIKICDVVDGVAQNYNSNNISDYFAIDNGVITFQSPDGSTIGTKIEGTFDVENTIAGVTTSLSNNNSTYNTGGTECNLLSTEVATNNVARVLTQAGSPDHTTQAALVTYINNVEQYRIANYSNQRPVIQAITFSPATNEDILVALDFSNNSILNTNGGQKFPGDLILQWGSAIANTGTTELVMVFETPFPNEIFAVSPSMDQSELPLGAHFITGHSLDGLNQFRVKFNTAISHPTIITYFAIGK